MCGLAGAYLSSRLEKTVLDVMLPGISHRGPDGVGSYIHKNVGLLHTRLSIIDTTSTGNQPLYNEDRSLVLICNGEIYNYQSLRKQLEERGHTFRSHSDSEVLVHLFEENRSTPETMLNQLKGMFAFAIYDEHEEKLFLARDRFGIKPLYYSVDRGELYFASEIQSVSNCLGCSISDIDYTSMYEYYQFLSIPEPNTIYKNVKALPAGHFATVKQNKLNIRRWYVLETKIHQRYSDARRFAADLIEKVEQVVTEHKVADVPIGSFLSAGIDSTVVTHFSAKNSREQFTSVSAGFPGYQEDESELAARSAETIGIAHYKYVLNTGFFDDTQQIVKYFDQPFAVSSAFSLFRISRIARQKMKVVLTGDGGDEVFGGYDHKHEPFYIPRVVQWTPSIFRTPVGRMLKKFSPTRLHSMAHQFLLTNSERFINRNRIKSEADAWNLIPVDKRSEVDKERFFQTVNQLFDKAEKFSLLHQLLFVDLHTFLVSEMLFKVDRMTMANGIEARVPFLDHELVEMSFAAPPHFLRASHQGKLPLRNWVNEHYPGLGSRKKTGFNAPLDRLLKEDQQMRTHVVSCIQGLKHSPIVDQDEWRRLLDKVENSESSASEVMLLFCLAGWMKITGYESDCAYT